MADTMQIMQWTLAQSCALRSASGANDPVEAMASTTNARAYARYLGHRDGAFGIFGDVLVMGHSYATTPKDKKKELSNYKYPCHGFVISKEFEKIDGAAGLAAMCRHCPANATPESPAGCAGSIYQFPESPGTQAQLESIISRLGLDASVGEAFPRTQPLWYGFWAKSPLSSRAVQVLLVIMEEMLEEDRIECEAKPEGDSRGHLRQLRTFVEALRIAEQGKAVLHVSLAPPGHTDFGYYTVFPHCPLCKAGARVGRWKRQYPTQLYTCHACGTQFPPAETASSEKDDHDFTELRDVLGQDRFCEFAKTYLMEQGLNESAAAELVVASEQWEVDRRAKRDEESRRDELQEAYIAKVLFAGLHPVRDTSDEDEGEDSGRLFNAEEFAEVLRRCAEKNIGVLLMSHTSTSGDFDRMTSRKITRPDEVFAKWKNEGCNELFGAFFGVPDELLEAFKKQQL